jgi:hypothetical protein
MVWGKYMNLNEEKCHFLFAGNNYEVVLLKQAFPPFGKVLVNLLVVKRGHQYICANKWIITLKELVRIHQNLANNQNWFKDLSVFKFKHLLRNHFLDSY